MNDFVRYSDRLLSDEKEKSSLIPQRSPYPIAPPLPIPIGWRSLLLPQPRLDLVALDLAGCAARQIGEGDEADVLGLLVASSLRRHRRTAHLR